MLCERCYKSKWRLSPGGQALDLTYCYMLRGPGLSKYLLNGGVTILQIIPFFLRILQDFLIILKDWEEAGMLIYLLFAT